VRDHFEIFHEGLGVDCFDAAYPSIQARAGLMLTDDGLVKADSTNDLVRHNARYLAHLTTRIRAAIKEACYDEFSREFCARWEHAASSTTAAPGAFASIAGHER
jgi:queuine/archaeosine tRNA-ribosyltransferase